MNLHPGQIIQSQTYSYEIGDVLYDNHDGRRKEYAAVARLSDDEDAPAQAVRLVVHYVHTQDMVKPLPEEEYYHTDDEITPLREVFCTYLGGEDNKRLYRIVVTGWAESASLAQAVTGEGWGVDSANAAFGAIVRRLRRLYRDGRGACHFNLIPQAVHLHTDAGGKTHALLLGMNFVAREYDREIFASEALDLVFRAPETHMDSFSPMSMEFTMALLYAWMLSGGKHPWGLKSEHESDAGEISCHEVYRAMRNDAPELDVDEGLQAPLRRALSFEPSRRYPKIDAFIRDLCEASSLDMGDGYDTFEPAGTDPVEVADYHRDGDKERERSQRERERRERRMRAEGLGGDGAKTPRDSSDDGNPGRRRDPVPEYDNNEKDDAPEGNPREPRLSVKMEPVKGDGFSAVAGMDQLKKDLKRDFIDIVNHRELAREFGLTIPGMLMYGPPGTGKTYIAQRLAEELGIDVTFVSPADLGNIFVHGSQTLIKQLFEKAERQARKNHKGVLLVFDEIDALVPQRSADDHSNQAGEVAEFLTRLNDASARGVYVIGTTNCLDRVDKAVIRKGRLDKVVYVGMPDEAARVELFKYELAKRPTDKAVDPQMLARLTDGYTSSDITYIVTESARHTFAEVIQRNDTTGSISQDVIEKVIADTRPSVTRGDLRHYEEMRDKYATGNRPTPSVGFSF